MKDGPEPSTLKPGSAESEPDPGHTIKRTMYQEQSIKYVYEEDDEALCGALCDLSFFSDPGFLNDPQMTRVRL